MMLDLRIQPDHYTLAALLHGYKKAGNTEEMESLVVKFKHILSL
jgi:pentatricopeptide repeat protein